MGPMLVVDVLELVTLWSLQLLLYIFCSPGLTVTFQDVDKVLIAPPDHPKGIR